MHILIVHNKKIPVIAYGGIERAIWYLAKELVNMGHQVTFLAEKGSFCDFARVFHLNPNQSVTEQIPRDVDVIQFNFYLPPSELEQLTIPYVVNIQGNLKDGVEFDVNTIFVSKNHAERHQAEAFVYNGMDWDDYQLPDLSKKENYLHFLAKAAWKVKNLKGSIKVATKIKGHHLKVLGGTRLNFNMGFRLTVNPRARFYGMVGGIEKFNLLNNSKALLFPVRWHEPFGIAITESMYYGCPVFGTTYGSLPELVHSEVGFLANSATALADAFTNFTFQPKLCHEYARDLFNSKVMADAYVLLYEKVLNGETLNKTIPQVFHQETKYLDWEN